VPFFFIRISWLIHLVSLLATNGNSARCRARLTATTSAHVVFANSFFAKLDNLTKLVYISELSLRLCSQNCIDFCGFRLLFIRVFSFLVIRRGGSLILIMLILKLVLFVLNRLLLLQELRCWVAGMTEVSLGPGF
jgi:hypothetical protein